MATITFRAFSHLRKTFANQGVDSTQPLTIPDGITVTELIQRYGLDDGDVEAVFVNHKIVPKSTVLQDGDRVSLVPPGGIPGHVAGYIGKKGME